MKPFHIHDLESVFHDTILSRGREYVDADRVAEIVEGRDGTFTARVRGTEWYTVEGSIDRASGTVSALSCTCPYDGGPFCKHEAAVLLFLRELDEGADSGEDGGFGTSALAKLLGTLERDELEEIIIDQATEDRMFRLRVFSEYGREPAERSMAELRSTIQQRIEGFKDRWGMIDYRDAYEAARVFDPLAEIADHHVERGAMREAFDAYRVMLEEAAEALTFVDDSGGEFGGVMQRAVDGMRALAEEDTDAEARRIMLEYVRDVLADDRFREIGDPGTGLWRLAAVVPRTEAEYRFARGFLENAAPPIPPEDSSVRSYKREQLMLLVLALIERFGDTSEAQAVRLENRALPAFRRQLIETAWAESDFATVSRFAEEGIAADGRWTGLVKEWREWAARAYRASGAIGEAHRVTRDIVLAGDAECLSSLKELTPAGEWPMVRAALLTDLANRPQHDFCSTQVRTQLFIMEAMWPQLMEYVEGVPQSIESYGAYLLPHYPERVRTIWEARLLEHARRTSTRKEYQTLASAIGRYADVAGSPRAATVRERILAEFPNRPALRDELTR